MPDKEAKEIFQKELLPHIDALHTFAYHLAYNEEQAKDLVQETYLKAYKNINSYTSGTNAKAWLFKILKNAFINEYRKKKSRPNAVSLDNEEIFVDLNETKRMNDMREEIYKDLLGDEITKAINSLPVDFRTVVLLCDIEGFTYEEIASIVDIPIGTVRSRLYRARNTLKRILGDYAEERGYTDYRGQKSNNE